MNPSLTVDFSQLESFALASNARGLDNSNGFINRLFKRTRQRCVDNIAPPSEIAYLVPSVYEVERNKVVGTIKNVSGVVCVENGEFNAINTNYLVPTKQGTKVIATKLFQVLDGVSATVKLDSSDPTKTLLNIGKTPRPLSDMAEELANPGLLNGCNGVGFDTMPVSKQNLLISNAKLPEQYQSLKKNCPRSFALLSISKGLNLSFDGIKPVLFNSERVVDAEALEFALSPMRLDKTIRDSKVRKVDLQDR